MPSCWIRSGVVLLAIGMAAPLSHATEPPVFDPIPSVTILSGESRDVPLHATDPQGRPLFFSLDFGPSFITVETTSHTDGVLHIVPDATIAGTFTVVVRVADEYLETETSDYFILTVDPRDGSPIAYPGGPYQSPGTVSFDGTNSYDPEGSTLSYLWDFGDNMQGVGAEPLHEYVPGVYVVTLTVTDNEGRTGRGETYAVIGGGSGPFTAYSRDHERIRLQSNAKVCLHLEDDDPFGRGLQAVVPGSIRMAYGPSEVYGSDKLNPISDADHDGLPDMRFCFSAEDMRLLFDDLPPGLQTVRAMIIGSYFIYPFTAFADLEVLVPGMSTVSPNPASQSVTLRFEQAESEFVAIRVFDVSGRLIRTLGRVQYSKGKHAIDFALVNNGGRPLASGVYLYEIRGAHIRRGRFLVVR